PLRQGDVGEAVVERIGETEVGEVDRSLDAPGQEPALQVPQVLTPVEVRVDEAPIPVSRTPGQLVEVGERVRIDEGRLPGRSEDDEGAGGDRDQRRGPRPG